MDDVTVLMTALKRGVRWDSKKHRVAYSIDWEEEDILENLSDSKRTMNVVQNIMNSIFKNIQVTVEVPENFDDDKLPVLDFKCWVDTKEYYQHIDDTSKTPVLTKRILYTFFEKEMSSKFSIMKTSALPEKSKISSLSNDMLRRMKNVSELLDQETRNIVVDNYARRLLMSGYKRDQVRQIAEAGLSGYERVVKLASQGKTRIHRSVASTSAARYKKKLVGKSTWFLGKAGAGADQSEEGEGQTDQTERAGAVADHNKKDEVKADHTEKAGAKADLQTITVLFVAQTPNGELASRLKKAEAELSQLCGNKVKIVEQAGVSLKTILVKANPLGELKCGRPLCLPCRHDDKKSDCKVRSITYQTTCLACKSDGIDRRYIGESARSAYERGVEHQTGYNSQSLDNHMYKHHQIDHLDAETQPEFTMSVIKKHQSPLYRQIHEAIMIMKFESVTLNSKGEFNRCQLPRLSVMMGEREVNKKDDSRIVDVDEDEDLDTTKTKRKQPPIKNVRKLKRRRIDLKVQAEAELGSDFRKMTTPQPEPSAKTAQVGTPKRKRLTEEDDHEWKMSSESARKRIRKPENAQSEPMQKSCPGTAKSEATSKPNRNLFNKILDNSNCKTQKSKGVKTLIEFFEETQATTKPKTSTRPPTPKLNVQAKKSQPPPTKPNLQAKLRTEKKSAKAPTSKGIGGIKIQINPNQRKISNYFERVKVKPPEDKAKLEGGTEPKNHQILKTSISC